MCGNIKLAFQTSLVLESLRRPLENCIEREGSIDTPFTITIVHVDNASCIPVPNKGKGDCGQVPK